MKGKKDSGLSETIGTILLVALVMGSISMVGVFLLASPPPEETPDVQAIVSMQSNITNPNLNKVIIYHSGGDPISKDNIKVVVDDVEQPDDVISLQDYSGDTYETWELGTHLLVDNVALDAGDVVVFYDSSGIRHKLVQYHLRDRDTFVISIYAPFATVSPSNTFTVEKGASISFCITPNTGYDISRLYINNEEVARTEDDCYTLTNVEENVFVYVTMSTPTIDGRVWEDTNADGIKDADESYRSGRSVSVEKETEGGWIAYDTTTTSSNGYYKFRVTNGNYRVRLGSLEPGWEYTSPVGGLSGEFTISADNDYQTDVDFGEYIPMITHTSSFQFPDHFWYTDGGNMYHYDFGDKDDDYWEYNTSYDTTLKKTTKADSNFSILPPRTTSGNSGFSVTPQDYNLYIRITNGDTSTSFYIFKRWEWNENPIYTETFTVPDNTEISGDELEYFMVNSGFVKFVFNKPSEGEHVPYGNVPVELHYWGTGEDQQNVYLRTSTNPTEQKIGYNSLFGYNEGYWDSTPYEGQDVTLTARQEMYSSSDVDTSIDISVAWEPLMVTLVTPEGGEIVSGDVSVEATVTGHNRNTDAVYFVAESDAGTDNLSMNYVPAQDKFTLTWDSRGHSGNTADLHVYAEPITGRGDPIESDTISVDVVSTGELTAIFSPNPTSGPAPLEVMFTDLSTGSPIVWNWDFNDGESSTDQNPVHVFTDPGTYTVTLSVEDAYHNPVSTTREITVEGELEDAVLITEAPKFATIRSGYNLTYSVVGSGSYAVINSSVHNFSDGDSVVMEILDDSSDGIIEISDGVISSFDCSEVELKVNDVSVAQGACTDISVSYQNLHSSLELEVSSVGAVTYFMWGSDWKLDGYDSQGLHLYEIMPDSKNMLYLNLENTRVFFVGRAVNYQLT